MHFFNNISYGDIRRRPIERIDRVSVGKREPAIPLKSKFHLGIHTVITTHGCNVSKMMDARRVYD
jgi:hypothetical protein